MILGMPQNINEIRQELSKKIGSKVTLTVFDSRNRVNEYEGVLSKTYPAVFVIDLDDSEKSVKTMSHKYIDILTGEIELQFN